MENGYNDGKLAEKFSGLSVATPTTTAGSGVSGADDSLFQVMKAVEAAEETIKQQVEENTLLRSELQKRILELERYRQDESMGKRPQSEEPWIEEGVGNQEYRVKSDIGMERRSENQSENRKINGALKIVPGARPPVDNTGFFSPSTTTSLSPQRYQIEGDYDRLNLSGGHGPMPMTEVNNPNSLWKQDLVVKTQEHEQEITQLRRHLQDYTIKEAQIRNEKYVLEKRIAYMRLAFDQQQQDLVDAASKALSYRQEIIEENIRLTYALQDAQQERTMFVSSLLPLLAEYSLQPPVLDAQSIVSNVKVLFRHLQEKLLLTESKLKESQYQLTPWRLDVSNSNFASQSPSPIGAALTTSTTTDWELRHPSGSGGVPANNLEHDDLGRYPPLASRNSAAHDIPVQIAVTRGDVHATHYGEETANKQVTFRDPVTNTEMDYQDLEGNQNERESSANWNSGNPLYTTTHDDPGSSYPYLPPVLEEPSSSLSEAADDDPLPAIEGLQISGDAFPGRELQACGYSINGTTSCNFEWVRHLEDGSVNYIDGAKQPNYLVNADDVDTYLAIEVQPLDNRKRKGELVKVFANDHRKITCDSEMLNHIEKTLYSGHASYKVSMSTGYLDIWEPATLAIKKEGYSIKCSGPSGVVVTEKFSLTTSVTIPYGQSTDFLIVGSGGGERLLRADNNLTDVSCSRDTIVLTLRFFILKAAERKKGKKRGFFNK